MYVCLCKGVTDRQIKAAINDGACSMGHLRKTLGVASQCGKCSTSARELLQAAQTESVMIDGLPQCYALG